MKSHLANLPPKLLGIITSLVCSDIGIGGRSLSLVSKQFYQLSLPLKYQSIHLENSKQIVAFQLQISQVPIEHRNVKNLYVTGFYDPLPEEEKMDAEYDGMSIGADVGSDDEMDQDMGDQPSDTDSAESRDSDYEGMLTADEQLELLQDAMDLTNVTDNRQYVVPGTVVYKPVLDHNALVLGAFRGILEAVSSSLEFLAVGWESTQPISFDDFLNSVPLLKLKEVYIYRALKTPSTFELPTTQPNLAFFPSLAKLGIYGIFEKYWQDVQASNQIEFTVSDCLDCHGSASVWIGGFLPSSGTFAQSKI